MSTRRRLVYPVATLLFVYFTGVYCLAVMFRYDNSEECLSVAWVLFSGSMTALALFFVADGVFMTR